MSKCSWWFISDNIPDCLGPFLWLKWPLWVLSSKQHHWVAPVLLSGTLFLNSDCVGCCWVQQRETGCLKKRIDGMWFISFLDHLLFTSNAISTLFRVCSCSSKVRQIAPIENVVSTDMLRWMRFSMDPSLDLSGFYPLQAGGSCPRRGKLVEWRRALLVFARRGDGEGNRARDRRWRLRRER